jgi:hypothetical protein
MQKIGNFENVFNDSNSQTSFNDLIQKDFFLNLFEALSYELKERFNDYFFCIFSTHDVSLLPAIINQNLNSDKLILFYISEETGYIPENLRVYFKAIFKTHMAYEPGGNIHSLTLGYIDEVIFSTVNLPTIEERNINIFFSGNLQRNRSDLYRQFSILRYIPLQILANLIRGPLINIFLKLFGSNYSSETKKIKVKFTNGFMRGYSKKEYKDLLLQTKILFCPKGFQMTETFRLFEGLNAGCIVISERLPEVDIYRNVPAIQIDSWKEGLEIAEKLLSNPVLLSKVQNDGILWWQSNCSYSSVAKRIVNIIGYQIFV